MVGIKHCSAPRWDDAECDEGDDDAAEDDDDVAEAARLLEQMQVPRVHGMGMHNFA